MKLSDLFIQCLENEGVKYVFGVPGEETEDLLFSMKDSTVQFIPTRHELGAAFMANVWGRLTGRAGVCLATLGPGATNLFTGVADANMDKAPVVAITGQGGTSRMHLESHQYLNIINMFKPITKWNTAVASTNVVPEIVRKAFKIAEFEKPGATHIELSEDLAHQEATGVCEPIPVIRLRRPAPDYKALKQSIDLLKNASRPLIMAGNGAIRKQASKQLNLLVRKFGIPVVSTFMGKGAISDRMDQSLLTIGLGFTDYIMEAVQEADLILTVGYDIAEYAPQKWNLNNRKRIVHIDFVPSEVYTSYTPEVECIADISAVLWEINQALQPEDVHFDQDWYRPIRKRILADIASYDLKDGDAFTVPGTLNEIRRILDDYGLMISDVGSHKMWIARNFPTYVPNGCIISNGLASMGIALPGAVAASLVDPNRQIVACMGDGGFMMNSQELETAKRLGVNFTAVVFNDNDYGLIRWKQTMSKGSATGTSLTNPDFKAYVESFGIKAYRPESVSELRTHLEEAIHSAELAVVEVPVQPQVNYELIEKLNNYWRDRS
ncbi:MAG: acetolactate synthase large subunit [Candidatus Neomarinimicrobiota bacterium]|nr:MAG: acetolactate synthase large subunit [Candidatus Neomarinimicrobiota bacterium]